MKYIVSLFSVFILASASAMAATDVNTAPDYETYELLTEAPEAAAPYASKLAPQPAVAAEASVDPTLHIAAQDNQIEIIKRLLKNGANPNARNELDQTPLLLAALNGHEEAAKLLLANGAEVNAQDYSGLTALHLSAQYGHVKVMDQLFDAGANVKAKTFAQGLTPIHWAAFWGHTEALQNLRKHGADINARDRIGDTPLTWAENFNHNTMARLIAAKGGKRHDDD